MLARVAGASDFDVDRSRWLTNLSVDVTSLISLRHTENVVAVAVLANGEYAERIDFLVEPLEEALMEEHRFTKLGDLRESVTLSQDPLPQLFRLAWFDAFREGQKRIDVERHQFSSRAIYRAVIMPCVKSITPRLRSRRPEWAIQNQAQTALFAPCHDVSHGGAAGNSAVRINMRHYRMTPIVSAGHQQYTAAYWHFPKKETTVYPAGSPCP